MQRDMDLIRKILLAVEEAPEGFATEDLIVDGYSDEAVGYHSFLAVEAGLAAGVDVTPDDAASPQAVITRLTWAGHEFLDAARDETRWREARRAIGDRAGSATFQVLSSVLAELTKKSLGL
jgi:hypothetical protein